MDLGAIQQTLANVNNVLNGSQVVQVKVAIPPKDIALLGGVVFLAMFLAVSLALLAVKR